MTQQEFFNRYSYDVVDDRIGGGGFGTVYKAYDNVLHREVAIKVSEVKTTADGKKTFSLRDEVEALSHVPEHPNIANYEKDKVYSFKTPQGIFDYAVMQYYPDGNLGNAIKKGLSAQQKEDIASQLLEGIAFLHQHKVVHRDLKPGNILIACHGNRIIPIITDFGLSKAADVVDGSVFSNSFGAGTPRYSSPEQLQGQPLRLNTDLWSYGAILYELFTGEQLFSAGSGAANTAQADMEIYNKIVNGNVQSLGKMPETWRKVAERCLVVDATKRAKDAGELFAIIKGDEDETEVTEGHGTRGDGPSSAPGRPSLSQQGAGGSKPTPPAGSTTNKPKKGLWIGLGIGIAAVVALVVILAKPKPYEPTPSETTTTNTANGHDYVDLGLPSGTLWATCNLGASKPEDYGDYYAWGETQPQSDNSYSWSSYKYAKGTSGVDPKLTKYCSQSEYGNNGFTDILTALQTSDDPAAANWGSGWQTPSSEQWEELLEYTDNEWTGQGRLFTSKKNGGLLFLPAACYRWDSELLFAGSLGYYWSRSLRTGNPSGAWNLYFSSDGCYLDLSSRSNGFTVRPVRQN